MLLSAFRFCRWPYQTVQQDTKWKKARSRLLESFSSTVSRYYPSSLRGPLTVGRVLTAISDFFTVRSHYLVRQLVKTVVKAG